MLCNFGFTVNVKLCDLTEEESNVIVNASNTELILGAGVSGAIRRKGGNRIQDQLSSIKKQTKQVNEGDVYVTGAGLLSNKNLKEIFHAVGPRYDKKANKDAVLQMTFYNCLAIAEKNGHSSISLPPISSGIFGYPLDKVCDLFYEVLGNFILDKIRNSQNFVLKTVNFCNNDFDGYKVMMKNLQNLKEFLQKSNYQYKFVLDYKSFEPDVEMEDFEAIESDFPTQMIDEEEIKRNNERVWKIVEEAKDKGQNISIDKKIVKKTEKKKIDNSNFKITDFFGKYK